ncbi:MAG: PEP-CTERM/exosortase system-associated acyltransferase [Candidatus Competibacteraceae bacterium]|nr:PEP-CTERM/exosortase system-associated acyltransferase [Candidatus Competibacteraceae bacterium]MCB1821126.1 PEP-CTERM/exosortase system-associated acyltransferase [Candidatus Competibacteraceae bacterium]HRY14311.1 PEP-CTERM/exosortase system-associated acyltransferase [Candidatus Competibacteraceae bacterium]
MRDFKELMEGFPLYFEIVIANTPELMKKAHQLRYEVFCQEFHFEREEDCPGGLEQDEYDDQALHCLILHRRSEFPAGCVRLIHTRQDDPHAPLPIERYCGACLYPGPTHPAQLPRAGLCEISRLAVSGHFRRRQGESVSPTGAAQSLQISSELEVRTFPLISMALFLAILSVAPLSGRRDSLSVMEPWLARQLRIMGFSFQQIGELTEYHGARAPFHYSAERAMADKAQRPILQQMFEVVDPLIEAEARRTGLI